MEFFSIFAMRCTNFPGFSFAEVTVSYVVISPIKLIRTAIDIAIKTNKIMCVVFISGLFANVSQKAIGTLEARSCAIVKSWSALTGNNK